MRSSYKTPDVAVSARRPDELDADLLVVPAFEAAPTADEAWVDEATGGALARARATGEVNGKLFDTFFAQVTAGSWKTRRVLLVGAGKAGEWSAERLRR